MAVTDRITGLNIGVASKPACVCAATTALTLSGVQTVDGISVGSNSERVLVPYQSTAANCGIYIADSSTWQRAKDCDGTKDLIPGTLVYVDRGNSNKRTLWVFNSSSTDYTIDVGTDDITIELATLSVTGVSSFVEGTLFPIDNSSDFRAAIGAIASTDAVGVNSTNTFTGVNEFSTSIFVRGQLNVTSTSPSANAGPVLNLERQSTTPAISDKIGTVNYSGMNSALTASTYCRTYTEITDETSGSEDANFVVATMMGGSLTVNSKWGLGAFLGGATDPGFGSFNATGSIYVEDSREVEKRWKYLGAVNVKSTDTAAVDLSTALPAGLCEIQVMMLGVDRSGSQANPLLLLGTSDGVLSGDYQCEGTANYAGSNTNFDSTLGLAFATTHSGGVLYGKGTLERISTAGYDWFWHAEVFGDSTPENIKTAGYVNSSGELTTLRIDTSTTTAYISTGVAVVRYR